MFLGELVMGLLKPLKTIEWLNSSNLESSSAEVPMVARGPFSSLSLSRTPNQGISSPLPSFQNKGLLLPSYSKSESDDTITLYICAFDSINREMIWYTFDVNPESTSLGQRDYICPTYDSSRNPNILHCPNYISNYECDSDDFDYHNYECDSDDFDCRKNCVWDWDEFDHEEEDEDDYVDEYDCFDYSLSVNQQFVHTVDDCYRGFLAPIACVFQPCGSKDSFAVLDQGKRLYYAATPIHVPLYGNYRNADLHCLDLSTPKACWYPRTPMTFERTRPHTWALGGKIFLLGGLTWEEGSNTSWCEVYDPHLDKWTTLPNPKGATRYPYRHLDMITAASMDPTSGRSIIFVGFLQQHELYMLDVLEQKWMSFGGDHDFISCTRSRIAAVGYTLIWLSRDLDFHAYDIRTRRRVQSSSLRSFLLPEAPVKDWFDSSSLVHIGGDMFCFLYTTPLREDHIPIHVSTSTSTSPRKVHIPIHVSTSTSPRKVQSRLHCCKFRAATSFAKPSITISVESCQSYGVQAHYCSTVAVMNHELHWRSTLSPRCLPSYRVCLDDSTKTV